MAQALENDTEPSATAAKPVPTVLFGRFMLPDTTEHPCRVGKISLSKALLLTDIEVFPGIQIVAYLEELGRVEGRVTETVAGGFEIGFEFNDARKERFRERLISLRDSAQHGESRADRRRHPRFRPNDNKSHLTLPDGRIYPCEVIDISLSGAAVSLDILPALGTSVTLGKMKGRVVRYIANGLAIEFTRHLDTEALKARIDG